MLGAPTRIFAPSIPEWINYYGPLPIGSMLIALASRFSRRPHGRGALVAAVLAAVGEPLEDRVVFLLSPDPGPASRS